MIAPMFFVLVGAWLVFSSGAGLVVAEQQEKRRAWFFVRLSLGVALLFYALYVARGYQF
jgi:hypothetical protein